MLFKTIISDWSLGSKELYYLNFVTYKQTNKTKKQENFFDSLQLILSLTLGQTLFCKSLGLKVLQWDGCQFDPLKLKLLKTNESVTEIIQTSRIGIANWNSEQLEYRFIDAKYVSKCTKNPLTMRNNKPTITMIQNYETSSS